MIFAGADATGFEEDARLTAMWLWTLAAPTGQKAVGAEDDSTDSDDDDEAGEKRAASGYALEYDAARKIAQGLPRLPADGGRSSRGHSRPKTLRLARFRACRV